MTFVKGHPNYCLHHSKESKKKISEANIRNGNRPSFAGRKHSDESKAKMSKSLQGKQLGNQHRKGLTPWNKGTKGLMSTWNKGTKGLMVAWNKGKKLPNQSGENHPGWIKDRSKVKIGDRDLNDPLQKQWSRSVKNRDGWKCRISNQECSGRLESHHILGWRDHPELRYEVNNGITLCHFHHPRKRNDEGRLSPYFQQLVAIKAN